MHRPISNEITIQTTKTYVKLINLPEDDNHNGMHGRNFFDNQFDQRTDFTVDDNYNNAQTRKVLS